MLMQLHSCPLQNSRCQGQERNKHTHIHIKTEYEDGILYHLDDDDDDDDDSSNTNQVTIIHEKRKKYIFI
jgi:hypothetical protein